MYIPVCLGTCGAISGLVGGGCTQCFPIWVGASTGSSIGCIVCMYVAAMPEPVTTHRSIEPRVIHNYLTHIPLNAQQSNNAEIYGESKDVNVSI